MSQPPPPSPPVSRESTAGAQTTIDVTIGEGFYELIICAMGSGEDTPLFGFIQYRYELGDGAFQAYNWGCGWLRATLPFVISRPIMFLGPGIIRTRVNQLDSTKTHTMHLWYRRLDVYPGVIGP